MYSSFITLRPGKLQLPFALSCIFDVLHVSYDYNNIVYIFLLNEKTYLFDISRIFYELSTKNSIFLH